MAVPRKAQLGTRRLLKWPVDFELFFSLLAFILQVMFLLNFNYGCEGALGCGSQAELAVSVDSHQWR